MTRLALLLGWGCILASACGKSRALGDGLDGARAGGAGGATAAAAGIGAGAASVSGGGAGESQHVSGAGAANQQSSCDLPESFGVVDYAELDERRWTDDAACAIRSMDPEQPPVLDVRPLAGRWLDDRSDERVELVLDETGNGTLTFGVSKEPEFDASGRYRTGIDPDDADGHQGFAPNPRLLGFTYTVLPRAGSEGELAFDISWSEPWSDWCAAQKPVRGADCYACEFTGEWFVMGRAACGERAGCYAGDTQTELVRVDCGRHALCGGERSVCWCNQDSCTQDRSRTSPFRAALDPFDATTLRFQGDSANYRLHYLVRTD